MGVKMELDQIAGLVLPKTASAQAETIEGEGALTPDLPDFSTIMQAEPAPDSAPELPLAERSNAPLLVKPETEPALPLEADMGAATPYEERPETAATTGKPAIDYVAISVAEADVSTSTTIAPATPVREPDTDETTPSAPTAWIYTAPVAAPVSDTSSAYVGVASNLISEAKAPAPLPQERAEVKSDSPVKAGVDPALLTQIQKPVAPPVSQPLQEVTPAKLEIEAKPDDTRPVTRDLIAPKTAAPAQPQPTPVMATAPLDPINDEQPDLQVGIRIERQAVEAAHISRPPPQAAPVASQISTQLPQLLTKAEKQTVELRLDPPELGRVTIHLTTNDQQVTALISADRVDTVDLMRRHAELLTATLARAGFSQADLSFQQGQSQNGEGKPQQFLGFSSAVESAEPALLPPTVIGLDGRLDIRL